MYLSIRQETYILFIVRDEWIAEISIGILYTLRDKMFYKCSSLI